MDERRHTDRAYTELLEQLRESLLLMAGRVEEMIRRSVLALVERDVAMADETIEEDNYVNQLEKDIDELCLLIVAKRQPMASDLRFVTLALKMVTDLERIGDIAVNICERVAHLSDPIPSVPWDAINRMAVVARGIVRGAIDAFVAGDAEAAAAIIEADDEVDRLYTETFEQLLGRMATATLPPPTAIDLLSIIKWIERIADHGTNLAEQVIFMVRGRDVRHEGKLPP